MTKFVITNEAYLSVGDDVYSKEGADDFTGSPWRGDDVTAEPQAITSSLYSTIYNLPAASLSASKNYILYQNAHSATFTVNYGSDANAILTSSVVSADVGSRAYFKGPDLPSNLVAGKPYWLINVVNGVSFEVEATEGSGTPVDLGDSGSGTLTYTLSSRRSSSDQVIGVLPATESSLQGEGYISAELQYIISIHSWLADGGRTDLLIDAILEDTGTSLPALLAAIQAKTDLINSGTVNTTNVEQTRINITRNDAYDGTANPAISFTVAKDFTSGWTGTLTIRHRITNDSLLSKSVTVTDATTLTVSLDSTDTAFSALTTNADFGPHPYDLQMLNGTSRQTPVQGVAMISRDETLT